MEVYKSHSVGCAPSSVYYIPNFITAEEELQILDKVYSVPKPKWTCLSKRRLQDYGGVPHKNGMLVEKIPPWLGAYMKKIDRLGVFEGKNSNHCLVNEYLPGQGIMPHSDGPLFYPTVTTITCGSHTVLEFCDSDRTKICDLLLERRSLVVLKDEMYTKYLHSIREVEEDVISDSYTNLSVCGGTYETGQVLKRDTRVSLTIRNVPKVCKLNIFNLK